jgi:hypothetical protein
VHLRLTLLFAVALTSCIRDDPKHCANQTEEDGDAYCERKYDGGLCSKCEAKYDGCVDPRVATVPAECRPDNVLTVASDSDASTDPTDASMSMSSDSIGDDSATSTSTTETSMSSMTSADDGSSSSDGGELPHCGNDMIDTQDETCDGFDSSAETCDDLLLSGGTVECFPAGSPNECTYDLSNCDSIVMCNNMEIEGNEQCEAGVPIKETCESLNPSFIGGELGCTMCMYNTTDCIPCVTGKGCVTVADCCMATLCLGGSCVL